MTAIVSLPTEIRYQPRHESFDGLVGGNFEPLFRFYSVFFDDVRVSLETTERTFRAVEELSGEPVLSLWRLAARRVLLHRHRCRLGRHWPPVTAVCLLLREVARLPYREIGEVLTLRREEVKRRIAEARLDLLGRMEV